MRKQRRYQSATVMEERINAYFDMCEHGRVLKKRDGTIKRDESGESITNAVVPSLEGLIEYLEMPRTSSFFDLKKKGQDWIDLVDSTLNKLTNVNIQKLYTRTSFQGSKFVLINKYGYNDSKTVKVDSSSRDADFDAETALKELGYVKNPRTATQESEADREQERKGEEESLRNVLTKDVD